MASKNGKKRKLTIYEYGGGGWYGQVYENTDGSWSWVLGIDFGFHLTFEGMHGFTASDAAARSMKARLWIITQEYYGERVRLQTIFRDKTGLVVK